MHQHLLQRTLKFTQNIYVSGLFVNLILSTKSDETSDPDLSYQSKRTFQTYTFVFVLISRLLQMKFFVFRNETGCWQRKDAARECAPFLSARFVLRSVFQFISMTFSILSILQWFFACPVRLKKSTKSNYKGDVGVQDLPVQIWTQCLRAMLPESSPIELSSMQVINVHTKHSVT